MEVGLIPGDFVLDGDPVPSPKRGQSPQIFSQCLLWPNGWMDQDGTWHGGRPQPRVFMLDGDQVPLPKKGAEPPIFRPMCIAAKWLHGSRCHLVQR